MDHTGGQSQLDLTAEAAMKCGAVSHLVEYVSGMKRIFTHGNKLQCGQNSLVQFYLKDFRLWWRSGGEPKSYAAGLEMCHPGGACLRLGR